MRKLRKSEVIDQICKKEEKYFGLVWYARTRPENIDIPGVRENIAKVVKESPDEAAKLVSDSGDWQHGFHSGMLAGMRYVLALYEDGVEMAEEEFPFLDT